MPASSWEDTAAAKAETLRLISEGMSTVAAVQQAGRSESTYDRWRQTDKDFAKAVDDIRHARRLYKQSKNRTEFAGDFATFSERYLGVKVFPHQQNIVDVIEGREPGWLHPSMVYTRGRSTRTLINVPPDHAKSMTITINYVTYYLATNPNARVVIVSKTREKAKEYLYAVQQRFTHNRYIDLQYQFAPGGFNTKDATWQADKIWFGQDLRDSAEKDPNVIALGVGSQIYGSRSDLIILDDVVTLSNAHEYEKQIRWIQQEVQSRLGASGRLVVLGTRVDNIDLYSEIVDPKRYHSEKSPWTVLRMPAVLEFSDDKKDWVTLWPRSDQGWDDDDRPDADGLFPRWDGPHLYDVRGDKDPKTWAMVYQQQEVDENSTFGSQLVRRAVNGMRKTGPLQADTPGHPKHGMQGMFVVASMDPAIVGDTGAVVLAVDRITKKRYVMDAACITSPTPAKIRNLIEDWTERYKPAEWRIEKNAFQGFLTQDEGIRAFLASRGVVLREHFTGNNKWDVNYGVASMAPLFGQMSTNDTGQPVADGQLIELPSTEGREGVKALVEQLITWSADTKNKTDMVMALWFAEIRAREWVNIGSGNSQTHLTNEFATPDRLEQQVVVNIEDLLAARSTYVA